METAARNEHIVHPGRRLGKAKPDPTKPRLRLAPFLTGVMPAVPITADHFARVPQWGLYRNSDWGICGPTGLANSRRLITQAVNGTMDAPPQADVTDLYVRSTDPHFDPATGANDNGVILQDMLAEAVKNGLGAHKPLGFAEVDHTNIDEMMAAVAVFGFLLIGVDLETAQQSQTDAHLWDYSRSGEWGGHAILGGRYTNPDGTLSDRMGVITWAEVVDMTAAFMDQQLDEAWVVIWPEHLRDNAFLNGVNLQAFADAYQQMTGRPFPATVPAPVPPPTPSVDPVTPPPVAPSGSTFQLDQVVLDHVASVARKNTGGDQSKWLNHHLRTYFRIG